MPCSPLLPTCYRRATMRVDSNATHPSGEGAGVVTRLLPPALAACANAPGWPIMPARRGCWFRLGLRDSCYSPRHEPLLLPLYSCLAPAPKSALIHRFRDAVRPLRVPDPHAGSGITHVVCRLIGSTTVQAQSAMQFQACREASWTSVQASEPGIGQVVWMKMSRPPAGKMRARQAGRTAHLWGCVAHELPYR